MSVTEKLQQKRNMVMAGFFLVLGSYCFLFDEALGENAAFAYRGPEHIHVFYRSALVVKWGFRGW